ncbi:PREDICTED: putative gustatory receptor 58b [Drosophila arizonae]|uniref:Gustatory receptor n=1 Tax=Drosophila arizonae TaxID=7263 RepID=A0ABM1PBS9_DROAR|nr:PREDICTED: putative gustatory receptor 58b [Drosophila arizonae]
MLHRRLRLLLYIGYSQVLIYGLLPSTLQSSLGRVSVSRVSAGYLIYSVCPALFVLAETPFMMASGLLGSYMRHNIVLQWSQLLMTSLRIVALLSCYGTVWLQRRRLMQLYADLLQRWHAHWPTLCRVNGAKSLERLQLELAGRMLRMLCVNYSMVILSLTMQFRLHARTNLLFFLFRIATMLMLSAQRVSFITLLILLIHQFRAVQLALHSLSRSRRSQAELSRVARIHSEWLLLARRVFSIYDLANASIFLNMFAVNVSIFYHAIQFGNKTIKSNYVGILIGDALVSLNILNSVLLMNLLDDALRACNDSALLLLQFNDLRRLSAESHKELELFGHRLRNNRLVYRICSCVILDKPACLSYMAAVLTHVILLMQFDLKRRHDQGLKYENFFKNEN